MKRKIFLEEFLGALGAIEIYFSENSEKFICGTAIFVHEHPEGKQDFCWHLGEQDVPNEDVRRIASLLKEDSLLSIDCIRITREELLTRYNKKFNTDFDLLTFIKLLETLESVEVSMVEEGKEIDAYFIHQ